MCCAGTLKSTPPDCILSQQKQKLVKAVQFYSFFRDQKMEFEPVLGFPCSALNFMTLSTDTRGFKNLYYFISISVFR